MPIQICLVSPLFFNVVSDNAGFDKFKQNRLIFMAFRLCWNLVFYRPNAGNLQIKKLKVFQALT